MIFHLGELFCGPGGIGWGATHADIGNEEFGIVHAVLILVTYALMHRRAFTAKMFIRLI